jgi:hypothetical protein
MGRSPTGYPPPLIAWVLLLLVSRCRFAWPCLIAGTDRLLHTTLCGSIAALGLFVHQPQCLVRWRYARRGCGTLSPSLIRLLPRVLSPLPILHSLLPSFISLRFTACLCTCCFCYFCCSCCSCCFCCSCCALPLPRLLPAPAVALVAPAALAALAAPGSVGPFFLPLPLPYCCRCRHRRCYCRCGHSCCGLPCCCYTASYCHRRCCRHHCPHSHYYHIVLLLPMPCSCP